VDREQNVINLVCKKERRAQREAGGKGYMAELTELLMTDD
jgi:hypothetical protein